MRGGAAALLAAVAALLTGCTTAAGPAVPSPAQDGWSVDLGAAVVGQPVAADGAVLAATEGNRVVSLDPASGRIRWSRTVGPR